MPSQGRGKRRRSQSRGCHILELDSTVSLVEKYSASLSKRGTRSVPVYRRLYERIPGGKNMSTQLIDG